MRDNSSERSSKSLKEIKQSKENCLKKLLPKKKGGEFYFKNCRRKKSSRNMLGKITAKKLRTESKREDNSFSSSKRPIEYSD
jgi:hypothetical protein